MTQEHPITPPPELVQEWVTDFAPKGMMTIATIAARWGADQELEACSQWIHGWYGNGSREVVGNLYAARRPKPPSLKEQAQSELERLIALISTEGALAMAEPIRRALEALPE